MVVIESWSAIAAEPGMGGAWDLEPGENVQSMCVPDVLILSWNLGLLILPVVEDG